MQRWSHLSAGRSPPGPAHPVTTQPLKPPHLTCCIRCAHTLHMSSRGGGCCSAAGSSRRRAGSATMTGGRRASAAASSSLICGGGGGGLPAGLLLRQCARATGGGKREGIREPGCGSAGGAGAGRQAPTAPPHRLPTAHGHLLYVLAAVVVQRPVRRSQARPHPSSSSAALAGGGLLIGGSHAGKPGRLGLQSGRGLQAEFRQGAGRSACSPGSVRAAACGGACAPTEVPAQAPPRPPPHPRVLQLDFSVLDSQRMNQLLIPLPRRLAPLPVQPCSNTVLLQAGLPRAGRRRRPHCARQQPPQPLKPGRGARHSERGCAAARARGAQRVAANQTTVAWRATHEWQPCKPQRLYSLHGAAPRHATRRTAVLRAWLPGSSALFTLADAPLQHRGAPEEVNWVPSGLLPCARCRRGPRPRPRRWAPQRLEKRRQRRIKQAREQLEWC